MENMRPENSFPQICVVSGKDSVEKSSENVFNFEHFLGTKGLCLLVTRNITLQSTALRLTRSIETTDLEDVACISDAGGKAGHAKVSRAARESGSIGISMVIRR